MYNTGIFYFDVQHILIVVRIAVVKEKSKIANVLT